MNLGEIADIRSGLVLSRKQARADSPQAIRYHQLSLRAVKAEGEIAPAELEPYFAKEPLSMDYLTQPNDIVVRLTAPYTAVLIDDTTRNLVITSNFVVIRIRGTELVPGYLYWYLNTPKAKRQIYQNTTKSMISSVNARYFYRLELQLPSPEIQRQMEELRLLAQQELRLLRKLEVEKRSCYEAMLEQMNHAQRKG